jgi:predicted permease
VQRQVDEELRFHFDMCVDELVARGMTAEHARLEAERRFGDVAAVRARLSRLDRQRVSEQRRADWWNALGQDTRYALRGLRRSPAFTSGVVITLALGIGANAAVFTFIDRLLLRAPPHVADADNLRRVHIEMTFKSGVTQTRAPMSYPEFAAIRAGVRAFDRISAVIYPQSVALGRGVDAPRVKVSGASADFFRTLGVKPVLGRFFVPEDDDDGVSRPAAVLGYGVWQLQFGGRSSVIGESLVLDGRPHVIVGVAPEGFSGVEIDAPDVWAPIAPMLAASEGTEWRGHKTGFGLQVIAHLRPGASADQAAAQAAIAVRPAYDGIFMADLPATVRLGSVIPGRRLDRTDTAISVATRLFGAAAMVLLIASANVTNLLLARALARRRELAVRLALGVGRARLIAHLLTESVLLALAAGLAAMAIAVWGGSLLRGLLMPGVTWASPPVDARVVAFTAAITMIVGLVAGLAPAIQMTRHDLTGSLKSGWRDVSGGGSAVRSTLLLVQAAFTVILLVGAGVFVRSLHNARAMDVGFDIDRTILVDVHFDKASVAAGDVDATYEAFAERVRRVPGVAGASVTSTAPYWTVTFERLWIPGHDSLPRDLRSPSINRVSPDYIRTMGMRLTVGRPFSAGDRDGAPLVAIVNSTMAKRAWPTESPLGKCLKIAADTAPCTTVVGVVADVGFMNLRDAPPPQYYVPIAQFGETGGGPRYLVIRTADGAGDPRGIAASARNALRGARAGMQSLSVRPFLDLLDPEIRPFRLGATMFGVFGVLALVLAGVGLYAVISFGVTLRTRELGVRAALGARVGDVVRLVLTDGLRVTALGVVVGLLLSLALGRVVDALLFGASPRDPFVFAIVAVTLLTVGVAASLVPAYRAARVDPLVALRDD